MNMMAKKKEISVGHEFKNEGVTWQFVEELLLTLAEEIVWNWEQGKSEHPGDEGEHSVLAARDWEQQ